ncbi:unnamed protein product [Scytosiphon promiscuus]
MGGRAQVGAVLSRGWFLRVECARRRRQRLVFELRNGISWWYTYTLPRFLCLVGCNKQQRVRTFDVVVYSVTPSSFLGPFSDGLFSLAKVLGVRTDKHTTLGGFLMLQWCSSQRRLLVHVPAPIHKL